MNRFRSGRDTLEQMKIREDGNETNRQKKKRQQQGAI